MVPVSGTSEKRLLCAHEFESLSFFVKNVVKSSNYLCCSHDLNHEDPENPNELKTLQRAV